MSKTPEKLYIGVTGVAQVNEAQLIAQAFVNEGLTREDSKHRGMIGVLASQKTLSRRDTTEVVKYPPLVKIRRIFQATRGTTFNTIHYSTYNPSQLSQQLELLLGQTGLYSDQLCDGVQLNIPWPSPTELEKTKVKFPNLKMILQLRPRVLSERNAEDVVNRLRPYGGLTDYTLIDPSGGRGTIFETARVAFIYHLIQDVYPGMAVVFAGGFDARNVRTRLELLSQAIGSSDFGIDAEGGLRMRKKGQITTSNATDLSTSRATTYIHNATLFFKKENMIKPSN